jgi:hypothetical protein
MDVHERNVGIAHGGKGETIADQPAGEPQAAGADEDYFDWHG